jgi:ubiquinone/menaquinone biosynthesis C-methylase UbiE
MYRKLMFKVQNILQASESIDDAKSKWNRLAVKNARYYVLTNKGESITEEDFRSAGMADVDTHFIKDDLIRNILTDRANVNVLEIGCGIGRLSEFIAPKVEKLFAIDISEEMISQGRKRLNHINNIELYSTDGVSLPLGSDSVEIVFSFIVFQHMPSKEIVRKNMEEISRVLRVGGIAKIQLRGVPVNKNEWYYGPSFTKKDAYKLIRDLPLEIVKLEGVGEKYFWIWFKKID